MKFTKKTAFYHLCPMCSARVPNANSFGHYLEHKEHSINKYVDTYDMKIENLEKYFKPKKEKKHAR